MPLEHRFRRCEPGFAFRDEFLTAFGKHNLPRSGVRLMEIISEI